MDKASVIKIRDEILGCLLPHVAFDGWQWPAVVQACEEAGYEPDMARAVFPSEMSDVLDAFSDLADREMLNALQDVNSDDLRIRDRIREALLARYHFLQPHREAVKQSLSFWMIPFRKPRAAKIVWRTADKIWGWAGDTSTDYNRYTKRGLLSGIIVSTTLVWVNDDEPDMSQTKEFLDRRIENVMQFNKVVGRFKPGQSASGNSQKVAS